MKRKANAVRRNPAQFKELFNTKTKAWKYYYDLIRTVYYNPKFEGCHRHHIMPKYAFELGLLTDNGMKDSPYNICYVTVEEHTVLHYCLYLCAKDERIKKAMNWAWVKLSEQSQLNRQDLKRVVYGKIQ